jgi:hypothetical protein
MFSSARIKAAKATACSGLTLVGTVVVAVVLAVLVSMEDVVDIGTVFSGLPLVRRSAWLIRSVVMLAVRYWWRLGGLRLMEVQAH